MQLWNPWLKKRIGKIVTSLEKTVADQKEFADNVNQLLQLLNLKLEK